MRKFIKKQLIKFVDFLVNKYNIKDKEILERLNKAKESK